MRAVNYVAFLGGLLAINSAQAAGDFPAASCKGWNGTIVEKSGVDSQSAMMRGTVTKADVQEYCGRDPARMTRQSGGKLTVEECVSQTQKDIGQLEMASMANCATGTLTFQYGDRPPRSIRFPLSSGADTSCASGMPPMIEQFKLLCPASASKMKLQ